MPAIRCLAALGLLLVLVTPGCDSPQPAAPPAALAPPPSPPPGPPPAAPANAAEFQQLLDTSVAELQAKMESHKAWGLGTFDRWDIDQQVGDLVFSNDDGTTATAPAQIIGSFSTNDNSWLWAWDNPSIVDAMKRDALKVKQYGEQHGIENLTTRKWIGTEEDAWAMAALAVKLTGAQGAYRGPSGKSFVFMTFGEVKLSKSPPVK